MTDRIIQFDKDGKEISGPVGLWDYPILNSAAEEPLIDDIVEEPVIDVLAERVSAARELNTNTDSDSNTTDGQDENNNMVAEGSEENNNTSEGDKLDSAENPKTAKQIKNNPSTLRNRVKDSFQFTEVGVGETKEVFDLKLSNDEALLIEEIANEWYSGLTFTLEVDGNKRKYQRSVADTDDPRDVTILASERIRWTVENDGSSSRTVGVLTDGQYIDQELYNELVKDDVETL